MLPSPIGDATTGWRRCYLRRAEVLLAGVSMLPAVLLAGVPMLPAELLAVLSSCRKGEEGGHGAVVKQRKRKMHLVRVFSRGDGHVAHARPGPDPPEDAQRFP
jgi:hypothetical protein